MNKQQTTTREKNPTGTILFCLNLFQLLCEKLNDFYFTAMSLFCEDLIQKKELIRVTSAKAPQPRIRSALVHRSFLIAGEAQLSLMTLPSVWERASMPNTWSLDLTLIMVLHLLL